MPSTAPGGGHAAARGGPGARRTPEALGRAGRGCGVRPPGGLAGTMNRAAQTHGARSSPPGRQESPFCWAAAAAVAAVAAATTTAAAAAAFLGMARPGRRGGRAGGGGWELSVLPSFLSLKSKSFPRGGARAAARARSAVSRPGLGGARGLQASRPRRAALLRDGGRGRRGGARISCLLPRSASGAGGGRAEGVAGAGAAAQSQSRAGACSDCAQRPPRSRARRPPRPGRRAALPASPRLASPRRLRARGPAPRRHALPDRAPCGRPLAVGASPSRSPGRLGPAAAQLSRAPGPCASDARRASPPPPRPRRLRRSPRRGGHPPGPRLLPFPSTSNFRARREKLKGRAGAETRRGRRPLPLPARPLRAAGRGCAGAARAASAPGPRLAPGLAAAARPSPPRSL
ncbi:hypothetical protein VULLAG_LOCUS4929 [Vulpes lagopus]